MASTKKAKPRNVEHSGHTPGPWIIMGNYHPQVWAGGTLLVPNVNARRDDIGGQQLSEIFANAKLIAAAPDLLAACERADALLGELRRHLSDLPAVHANNVLETVRAAIAKARA